MGLRGTVSADPCLRWSADLVDQQHPAGPLNEQEFKRSLERIWARDQQGR